MTVVNPKSISGINSITTGSGSDNLLTIHTSDASNTERVRINSSGDVIVGSGITVSPDGDVFATGVCTATSFSGDGSSLTGIAATDNVRTGILDVAGVGTFRGDVNIPDKIIHLGDTDTAIRFPSADTFTVETAGSEKLRIASNGNITYSAASGENTIISKRTNSAGSNGNYFFHLNANNSDNNTVGSLGFHRDTATDDSRIVLSTRTSGGSNTERLRITSDGKFGFNNTDPSAEIELSFDSGSTAPASGTAPKGIALSYGGTDGHNAGIWFSSEFGGDQGICGISGSRTSGYNTDLKFYTNSTGSARAFTECARFISSGFLKAKGNSASYHDTSTGYHELIGDTTHDVVAKLKHNSSTGYGLQTLFNHANSSIYALSVRDYSSGNTDKAFIRCDGDLENVNNSYGGTSDVKLKENIVDAKSQWDDIKALKVRNFNYKADENKTKFLGLVAQEAETVCPSLVKSQPDLGENNEDLGTETKVLKYSILYMKAVKALQESMARIEALEAEVAALKSA